MMRPEQAFTVTRAGRVARAREAGGRGMFGQPQRTIGKAGGDDRLCVVAGQGRALGKPGIEQRWRLAVGKELRA